MYEYPQLYDWILLSNILDYIGGSLITFLDGLPVLHEGDLSSPADIEKDFQVRMKPYGPDPHDKLPMIEHMTWHQCHQSKTLSDRMARSDVETWLYRLFLKMAIPVQCQVRGNTLIYSPTNLTVFIRLCSHLRNIGYPAHWIGGVIASILSSKITTKVRPPRSDPLKIPEVKTEMPMSSQSTKPLVAELFFLLGICAAVLPFGIPSANITPSGTVRRYSSRLGSIPDDPVTEPPAFVLVLLRRSLSFKIHFDIRPYLLRDEKADKSALADEVRERGMHVATTWAWDRRIRNGSF